jgi:uncharacterized repeat protein (TIGR01451 family)
LMSMTATPDPAAPGETVVYQLTVSNVGSAASNAFSVYLTLPNGTTANYGSAAPGLFTSNCGSGANGCTPGDTVYWSYGGLVAGASATFQLPVTVAVTGAPPAGSVVPVNALVYYGSNGGASAAQNFIVAANPIPELGISDQPNLVTANGALTYVLNYSNPTSSAANLSLSLPLPAGTSLVSATNSGTVSGNAVLWNLGSVPAGTSGQQQVTLSVPGNSSNGTLLATTANLYDTSTSESYARAGRVSTVVAGSSGSAQLLMSMTATPDPAAPGETVVYQLTVSNVGGAASNAFTLYLTLPSGTTANYSSAAPGLYTSNCGTGANGCTPGDTVYWSYGGLAAGASTTFQLPVTVDVTGAPPSGSLIPAAAVIYYSGSSSGSAQQNFVVASSEGLNVGITNAPNETAPGGSLVYNVTYGNSSGSPVNSSLSLPLPANTSVSSISNGGAVNGNSIVWNLGAIPAGAGGQVQATVQIGKSVASGTQLMTTANLYATSSQQSYARASNVSYVSLVPSKAGLLAVSVSATPDPVVSGQNVVYQVTVQNIGGATSGGFDLYLTLPNGTTANSSSATPGLYSSDCGAGGANGCTPGQTVYWSNGGLAAGASTTFALPVTVDISGAPPSGSVLNAAATIYNGANGGGSVEIDTSVGGGGSFSGISYPSNQTSGDVPIPAWANLCLGICLFSLLQFARRRRAQ